MKQIPFMLFLLFITKVSIAQISPKDSLIIRSFYQGPNAGNCASISVIKLAIAKYGADHVFNSIEYVQSGYRVHLQDDVVIMLSKMEEDTISHLDKFQLGTSCDILQKAKFMYAVMAKNKMQINKLASIKEAATSEKGFLLFTDTEVNFGYLGLKPKMNKVDINTINNSPDIIITNTKHSAFACNGLYDEYGELTSNSFFVSNHSKWLARTFSGRQINKAYSLNN